MTAPDAGGGHRPALERFAGRCVLVTGASRGIGAAVALQFAAEGADVAIVARSLEPHDRIAGSLNETAEGVRRHGARCLVIAADLSDADDRARIVPEALDGLGHVDILVNNAAAAIYQTPPTYSLKHRRLSMEVNYQAPADLMQAVIPHLVEAGEGWIVNLTSAAARPVAGPPFEVAVEIGLYGATKAALNRLTNAMAASVYGTGIRVNAVMPRAAVLSEGADALVGSMLRPEQVEPMASMVEAVLALSECEPDRTGNVYVSLDLLAELAQS
ncbi:MAG: SDR family NAD(P)-dependent oxidoreductase [Acidimicrobiales bacterium]